MALWSWQQPTGTYNKRTLQAEQTLNQLLACMDGLDTNNNGIVVVAATNNRYMLQGGVAGAAGLHGRP
jgi:AAA+ superfamily predicted ATPase